MVISDFSRLQVLAEGGEAIIYVYNYGLIKVYKPHINIAQKEKKIKMLINLKLNIPAILPLEIVYDSSNKFIGYYMNRIDGEDFKQLSNKKFVSANNITLKDIVSMLIKIKDALDVLHSNNIFIGDLNDQNILFDSKFNVYIIDCCSWSIGGENCVCAMDLFKDPKLKADNFNKETDMYSFSVLCWKSITKIHPFGGTMNPDMNILERINNGISVIDNPNVKIPKTIKPWNNLSPDFVSKMKEVFSGKTRDIGISVIDMGNNLKLCAVDNEFYYGKFNSCPICNSNAKVITKPVYNGSKSGLNIIPLLDSSKIKSVININTFINNSGNIVLGNKNIEVVPNFGSKYHIMDTVINGNNVIIEETYDKIMFLGYSIPKKYKSSVIIDNNKVYYISQQCSLTELSIFEYGNSIKVLCKCSANCYFNVVNGKYCVVNFYKNVIIVNNDGFNCEIKNTIDSVIEYGIHYDDKKGNWLIVLEYETEKFFTVVVNGTSNVYESYNIKYKANLGCICFSSGIIFIPMDESIRGFYYSELSIKDFECDIVGYNSKLIRTKEGFVVINDENIYRVYK